MPYSTPWSKLGVHPRRRSPSESPGSLYLTRTREERKDRNLCWPAHTGNSCFQLYTDIYKNLHNKASKDFTFFLANISKTFTGMHWNYMLTYGALSSLTNSKINFWKYKKYCALNISECWGAYSKLFSLPRKNVTVPVSASWKSSHSHIQGGPPYGYGCPKIPDCPYSVRSRKGGGKTPM